MLKNDFFSRRRRKRQWWYGERKGAEKTLIRLIHKTMDESWDWPRIRQSVAERVLNRHMQDQQEVAMDAASGFHHHYHRRHSHHHQHRVHRERESNSLIPESTDELARPKTRRHSVPAPSLTGSGLDDYTQHGRRHSRDLAAAERSQPPRGDSPDSDQEIPAEGPDILNLQQGEDDDTEATADSMAGSMRSGRESPNLLDMMKSTLQSVKDMEEQRQSFHLNQSAGKQKQQQQQQKSPSKYQQKPRRSSTTTTTDSSNSSRQRPQAAVRRLSVDQPPIPRLEREQTFINGDQFQVLSLDGGRPGHADNPDARKSGSSSKHDQGSPKHNENSAKKKATSSSNPVSASPTQSEATSEERPDVGGATMSQTSNQGESNTAPKPRPHQQRREHVNVEFVDDDKGLEKVKVGKEGLEKSPIDPKSLSLPIHLLNDDDDHDDGVNDDNDEQQTVEGKGKMMFAEGDETWDEVRKCRYIRGYDPPNMRMPQDFVGYVFKDEQNGAENQ